MLNPEQLALVRRRLEDAERNLQLARKLLTGTTEGTELPGITDGLGNAPDSDAGQRVIYGRFDGEHMEGEDAQLYPVPANYASKSKLVEGDKLKLTIEEDGAFVYKQVGPVERRRVLGTFVLDDNGTDVVEAEGKKYRILLASVTFYRLERGSQVTILLPTEGEARWGAVENSMKAGAPVLKGASETSPPSGA
jgi:hypothetical protein